MLRIEEVCELPRDAVPASFRVKWADAGWEIAQARRLRRQVFCVEQGLFGGAAGAGDRDAVDADAQTLVAVSELGGMPDRVVGTVRIHADHDGLWWGSRLAVEPACRPLGGLGAALIRLAVCSAHARGARLFLAHVQAPNRPLFEKLHWQALRPLQLHGTAHWLMQADLAHYPPCHDPISGWALRAARSGGAGGGR